MQKQFFEVRRKLNQQTFLLYTLFFIVTTLLLTCVHLLISRIDWHRTTSELSLKLNHQLDWDSEINVTITSSLLIFIVSCFLYKYFTTRRGDLIARQLQTIIAIHITRHLIVPLSKCPLLQALPHLEPLY